VKVSIDAAERSSAEAMTQDFVLADGSAWPWERQGAVAGEGTIRLDPALPGPDLMGCGSVSRELELTGLEAEDGTTFAPIRVRSDSIGCYSG
jgi:hypothetical protein